MTAATPSPVAEALTAMKLAADEIERLRAALRPFVEAYRRGAHPIPDSDLYDEQPRSVSVTLGDCRRAARVPR